MSNELYHKTWEDLYYESEVRNNKLQKKVEILTKKVEILTKACEFYQFVDTEFKTISGFRSQDKGKAARQALKECKELG